MFIALLSYRNTQYPVVSNFQRLRTLLKILSRRSPNEDAGTTMMRMFGDPDTVSAGASSQPQLDLMTMDSQSEKKRIPEADLDLMSYSAAEVELVKEVRKKKQQHKKLPLAIFFFN